jgi:hypothetical protein
MFILMAQYNVDWNNNKTALKCIHCSNKSTPYTVQATFLPSSMALEPFAGPGSFFGFLILYRVGRTPWTRDQPVWRPLPTHRTAQTQNKRTQTSMPWVEFEPSTSVFERTKRVHSLDCAATLTGCTGSLTGNKILCKFVWISYRRMNTENVLQT